MVLETVRDVIFPRGGSEKKYDSTSNCYHLIMGVFECKPNMYALELANIKEGEKVLDLAFGTGWVLEKIIPLVGENEYVYGIDFAPGMHRVTRQRLAKKHMESRVKLILENILSMPYKDNFFDVIFASFILDLQKNKDIPKLLAEIKRVLKPGGRVVIVAMTKEGKGLLKLARCFYDLFYPFWPTIYGYRASSRPIFVNSEIKKAGFSIKKEKLTHIVFFHFPIKIVVAKKI
jgi:demethylmenaquinone methyltransferase/2-methoxy-6-polyprenyl-1,4-benzoquinol methylase